MSMMEFCTFGIEPLGIMLIAGMFGAGCEAMNWAAGRGLAHGCWIVGILGALGFFWSWAVLAGAFRLIAWAAAA